MKQYDVIILGGGIVGLTTAFLLANCNIQCALIEQKKTLLENPVNDTNDYDLRVFALTEGSRHCFEALGIWEYIANKRISSFENMHIWDSQGFGKLTFEAQTVNQAALGYIVENRVIQEALFSKISHYQNIDFISGVTPQDFKIQGDKIELTVEGPEQSLKHFSSSLIIGADGALSWLRETAKLTSEKRDYRQNALIAHVKTEFSHQNTAWQRFLPQGPLAFLPLNDPHHCSIVWSHDTQNSDFLKTCPNSIFEQQLASAFDYRLGKTTLLSERKCFPLYGLSLDRIIDERIALLGEAAHVIHPLAGLGLNLGIIDAVSLANTLSHAKQQGLDLGRQGVLRRYERQRKAQVWAVKRLMEFFKQYFGSSNDLIIGLRSWALSFTQRSHFLKRFVMSLASLVSDQQSQFLSEMKTSLHEI